MVARKRTVITVHCKEKKKKETEKKSGIQLK